MPFHLEVSGNRIGCLIPPGFFAARDMGPRYPPNTVVFGQNPLIQTGAANLIFRPATAFPKVFGACESPLLASHKCRMPKEP